MCHTKLTSWLEQYKTSAATIQTGWIWTPYIIQLREIEATIARCLIAQSNLGYPCIKDEFTKLVGKYLKSNDIKNSFKDEICGNDWY